MKSLRILMMTALVVISANLFAQTTKTEKIKVYGNCSVCKKHIETASKTEGVIAAEWNKKTKWLTVTYDSAKTTNDLIQKNVAASGYDTEGFKGDDNAYNDLDPCCQYDRKVSSSPVKKMNR
jgi:copper chaperone CopZ